VHATCLKHIHYLVILVFSEYVQNSFRILLSKILNHCIFFNARNRISGQGQQIFLSSTSSRPVLGPPLRPILSYVALALRVKKLGSQADHSPPSCSRVKNEWSCTSTPPSYLCFVKRETVFHTTIAILNESL
jgi:hypothetical protein